MKKKIQDIIETLSTKLAGGFSLEPHLKKAGLSVEERRVKKILFQCAVWISLAISFYVILKATQAEKSAQDLLVFMAGYWTAFFFGVLIFVTILFLLYLDIKTYLQARKERKEQKEEGMEEIREGYTWKAFLPWTDEKDEGGFSFDAYLRKAGFENWSGKEIKKLLFKISVYLSLFISVFIILSAIQARKDAQSLLIFMAGYWTAFFCLIWIIILLGFTIYLDIKAYRRKKEVEKVLPDFLQLASANISAGMPIDRALWFAVRPSFGILAEEIEKVAKATYAGEDLEDALTDFSEKFDSADLERAVNLIKEGMEAGGEMADLLNRIAMNIEETRILKQEMSANVTTYVIFIGVATLLGAPFLFGLATQLLTIIKSIAGNIGGAGASGGGLISMDVSQDAVAIGDFRIYSMAMLTVTSMFSGAIISVIRKGNVKEGVVLIPALIGGTLFLYYVANLALGGLMGAFV